MIMLGLTAIVCFGLLEFGLARYYHSTESQISMTVFDPTIGWRLRPGAYSVKPRHTFSTHQISIDDRGLRDESAGATNDGEGARVVILGDSFTFASAIPNEDTFPALMAKMPEAGARRFQVINAGVQGYGTAQELLHMKDLAGRNIVGDVYVLMIFINDILDNLRLGEYGASERSPAQPGFELQPDGELKLTHHPKEEHSENLAPPSRKFFTTEVLTNSVRTFLQTKPTLVSFFTALGVQPTIHRMPSLISGWYLEEVVNPGVPLMKALIKEIREEARRNNAQLVASMIPSPIQVYPDVYHPILVRTFHSDAALGSYVADPAKPQKTVAKICEELEIPFLDLHPILVQNNGQELFIPADGHFSQAGHQVVARHLTAFVAQHAAPAASRKH